LRQKLNAPAQVGAFFFAPEPRFASGRETSFAASGTGVAQGEKPVDAPGFLSVGWIDGMDGKRKRWAAGQATGGASPGVV
jgi:hypothetical protein